jgi:hypothetical protein
VTDDELDQLILGNAKARWQKVARIVGKVADDANVPYDRAAGRIATLVREGRLIGQSDLSDWRGSEVRLPE